MKYLFFILCLFSIFYIGCKKDTKVESTNSGPSERYKALTSHYWRLAEKWQDTTVYGKAHPELIPLPSSTNAYVFVDSCQYYTSSLYSTNGWYYYIKRPGCSPCNSSPTPCVIKDGAPWSLSADEQTFYGPYDIEKIISVNDSVFKSYSIQIYNFNKTLVEVYVHKVYVY